MTERNSELRKLWVGGKNRELHDEYPVPTSSELRGRWSRYVGDGKIVDAPSVYGVLRLPDHPPRAYASIDVCEVLRRTHDSIRLVEEPVPKPIKSIYPYGDGLSFEGNSTDVISISQVLINNGMVPPVDGIREIAKIMQGWRKEGIYTFANTSTNPGCEPGTIDFFAEHLPDAFDGLLFPRNHDGKHPLTKGVVARDLIQVIPPREDKIIAVKIDDSPHHNISFRKEVGSLPDSKIKTFQPTYPSHYPVDGGTVITPTPLEAFQAADAFLREALRES